MLGFQGATRAQAKVALRQYKDVMEAAEAIFDGKFADVPDDDGDVLMSPTTKPSPKTIRTPSPEGDEDEEAEHAGDSNEDDDSMDGYDAYDSDFESTTAQGSKVANGDPYAGIFFSKDRREEVIEVEETAEDYEIPGTSERVKLMTQGEWMKGCPEGGEQGFLFGLYHELIDGHCQCPQKCGESIPRHKSDFFAIHSSFPAYTERLKNTVRKTCRNCHTDYCLACGEPISGERTKRVGSTAEDDILFHCPNLQGVILGVGLFMLEQQFIEPAPESHGSDESDRIPKRRKTNAPGSITSEWETQNYMSEVGRKAKGGIGYAGDQKEDHSGQLQAQAQQKLKDEKLGKLLANIRVYLPNLHREKGGQASDYLVHPTALAHLRRRFNFVCSALLRNDSLADMSERSVLYFELMEWLGTVSSHEALASMMAMPIMVASTKSVTPRRSSRATRERTVIYEGSASPRELLENIAIQAQAAMKGLERGKASEAPPEELTEEQKRMTTDVKGKVKESTPPPEENRRLFDFCRRILATVEAIDRSLRETKGDGFVERLHASLPRLASATEMSTEHVRIDANASEETTQKTYIDWATRARFEYCDLSLPRAGDEDEDSPPHYKFYYDNDARMLASSDIPKRSLAIAKELAILTTNLPVAWDSSIFLRVDETRVDIIKALITGPEGTPYQNGCFLFDIFLGSSYNQSPPSVKYLTTNGGKFRFNPNLYADGKVCLSLLGTWSGPGWVPGKSTLLQVLISIQSMILCDEPYLNEPGWASSGGTPQSHAYSANVRRMVVKTAMLGNLLEPPEPFEDVIRTHFRVKARSITAQLDDWLSKDDGRSTLPDGGGHQSTKASGNSSSNGFKKDVDDLKAFLVRLQEESD
ncbi:hypothetical protein AX16_003128 [Volvariella volvacea WC 439]|nr:hypothetical protein AX16_003128 [Volvariella volvacea WC 439]